MSFALVLVLYASLCDTSTVVYCATLSLVLPFWHDVRRAQARYPKSQCLIQFLCLSAHVQMRAYGSLVVCLFLSFCLSVCLLLVYLFPWWNSSPSICFYVLKIILSWIQIFEIKLGCGYYNSLPRSLEGFYRALILLQRLLRSQTCSQWITLQLGISFILWL